MITRDNYEEFFLLYVDNELSVTDRRLVEAFVGDNPDLKEEWESLLQCRIQSDTAEGPVFAGKEGLMKFAEEEEEGIGGAGVGGRVCPPASFEIAGVGKTTSDRHPAR